MSDVTSFEVTGDWRHIVDDGMSDLDDLPDEVLPTGTVRFTPVGPALATAGDPIVGYTLGTVPALIAAGRLTDLQGREGVRLAGVIGVETIRWQATVRVTWQEQNVAEWEIVFDLESDLRLSAERPEMGRLPALVVSQVERHRRDAVAAADRAETARGVAEDAAEDAKGYRDEAGGHAGTAGVERAASQAAATLAGEHAAQAGVERWAAVDERWAAEGYRNQAIGAKDDTIVVRGEVEALRAAAGTSADEAAGSAAAADGHAGRAELAADSFGLTATATTGAAGSNATVTVTGDGPAYGLAFTVPRGDKGDQGDSGVQVFPVDDLPAVGVPGVLYATYEQE